MERKNAKVNLNFLDGIRGLAALYVLIHHARLLLTQPYYEGYLKHPELYSLSDKLMVYGFSAFKFGHEAVLIFFVLSGFVIHLKQAKYKESQFSTLDFYQKRLIRIYPTLITAMVFTFLCGLALRMWFQLPMLGFKIENFLFNFFLIPEAPIWGFNYPMWSLKHEWFFYILYPVLYFITKKTNYLVSLILPISITILFILGIKIPFIGEAAYTILFWWLGAGLAEMYAVGRLNKKLFFIQFPLIIILFFIEHKISFSLIFCFIVLCNLAYLLNTPNGKPANLLRKLKFTGDFSFSLYLLHFPLQSVFKEVYTHNYGQLPYHFGLVWLGIILPLPLIYVIYLMTEKKAIHFKESKFTN